MNWKLRYNRVSLGVVLGTLGPFLGFWFYYFITLMGGQMKHTPMGFVHFVMNTPSVQSPVVSLSLIMNLALFFFFIWKKMDLAARGVLTMTMFAWAPLVVYLKFH
ncbi:MAG: hypothetical protein H6585_05165 [Flavobacteriales bacterium]|nr:hypothetical protein [Flavobacteriales bacterium]MCB9447718.1 hypothetical protein [Flavobacteriales bacterium]